MITRVTAGTLVRAALIHLHLRPGLLTVDQRLAQVLAAVPVEPPDVMRPLTAG